MNREQVKSNILFCFLTLLHYRSSQSHRTNTQCLCRKAAVKCCGYSFWISFAVRFSADVLIGSTVMRRFTWNWNSIYKSYKNSEAILQFCFIWSQRTHGKEKQVLDFFFPILDSIVSRLTVAIPGSSNSITQTYKRLISNVKYFIFPLLKNILQNPEVTHLICNTVNLFENEHRVSVIEVDVNNCVFLKCRVLSFCKKLWTGQKLFFLSAINCNKLTVNGFGFSLILGFFEIFPNKCKRCISKYFNLQVSTLGNTVKRPLKWPVAHEPLSRTG